MNDFESHSQQFQFQDLNAIFYMDQVYFCLTNKEAKAVYYTVIKHDEHLRTRGKCRKHEPQASVFYISRVFSNVRSVLSQCNTRIRLLHLLYDSGAPAAEGCQAEPHTHIRKLKGTHELIFSYVSWLAVLLVGAYARRRRRRRRRRWWSRATWRPQLTRKPKRGFSFRGLSL